MGRNKKNYSKKVMLAEAQRQILQPDIMLRNSFILTKKMHRQYSKQTYHIFRKKWKNKVIMLALATLAVGLLLIFLLRWYIAGAIILVAGIYFFLMGLFGYVYGSWREYRNFQDFFGPLVEMEVEFYKRYFRVKTVKGNREFLYSQVMKRIELENISILIVGAEGMIVHGQIIDKKAFEPAELEKYYDILENAGIPIS